MPRGGSRIGSGRKRGPKIGYARARVLQHPSAPPPAPPDPVAPPDALTPAERAIWVTQAPHAIAHRTLTPASALAFARYCQIVVLEGHEAQSSARGGSNHRGLLKQLNAYELQFLLSPAAKPMPDARPVVQADADDLFFGGPRADGH